MNPSVVQWLNLPVFQITLPIVVTMLVAAWLNNRRIEEVSRRLDDTIRRLDTIEQRLDTRFERIETRFERVDERLNEILSLLRDLDKRVSVLEDRNGRVIR